jgi:integrase
VQVAKLTGKRIEDLAPRARRESPARRSRPGRKPNHRAWRRVKPFRAVEMACVRYLSEPECVRLVNACEPAFRNLVRGAVLTGCSYSELTTMHVADFNADAGVVTVRESKAGRPRHVVVADRAQNAMRRTHLDRDPRAGVEHRWL